jgi:hypothetical protein
MLRRTVLALSLATVLAVLGCGAAPAAVPAQSGATPPADAAPGAAGASPASATTPPPGQDNGNTKAEKTDASPPPVSRAVATDAPITTKITQDDILALVQKNTDAFYRCYSLGAGTAKKSYRAKVTVRATVSPVGAVNAVDVVSSTAKNPKVDACVIDAFKKLTFTRAPGSGATVFTFPLSFDGMEQVP